MYEVLAAFLVTYYVTSELSGAFGILDRFRKIMHTRETTAQAIDCPFCFSFWAALLVTILPKRVNKVLGTAGAVCLLYLGHNRIGEAADAFTDWLLDANDE